MRIDHLEGVEGGGEGVIVRMQPLSMLPSLLLFLTLLRLRLLLLLLPPHVTGMVMPKMQLVCFIATHTMSMPMPMYMHAGVGSFAPVLPPLTLFSLALGLVIYKLWKHSSDDVVFRKRRAGHLMHQLTEILWGIHAYARVVVCVCVNA